MKRLDQLQTDMSESVVALLRLEQLFDGLEIFLMKTSDLFRRWVKRGLDNDRCTY